MKRVVRIPPAEWMMSGRSAKSSMTVRICGRNFVDLASLRVFILSRWSSRIFLRAFLFHSLWNQDPSTFAAFSLAGSQAESMSTEGEKTWIWSKTPA